jgi:hypothetical protein
VGKIRDALKTARLVRQANRLYRHQTGERRLLFPELRRKRMVTLIRKNSKMIGAAIGGAIALALGSLIPDLASSDDLAAFEASLGAIIGAMIGTWFAPKNAQ